MNLLQLSDNAMNANEKYEAILKRYGLKRPSYLSGMARIVSPFATSNFNRRTLKKYLQEGTTISDSWEAVGDYLRQAIKEYGEKIKPSDDR